MSLRKKLNILLIVLMIFVSMFAVAYGTVLCTLDVKIADDCGNPVAGIDVEIFKVASRENSSFTITDDFRRGITDTEDLLSGNGAVTASKLQQYVFSNDMYGEVRTSSDNGTAVFYGLDKGIYLVMERGNQRISFHPYLIMLPHSTGGNQQYYVNSEPKISETDTLAVKVTIKWIDNNNAAGKRPDGVIVQLLQENSSAAGSMLRASTVQKLTAINGEMNWKYVFTGLNVNGIYNVRQLPVKEYETTYSGNMYEGFVITNILKMEDPGPWYPEDPDDPVNPDNPDNPPGDDPSDSDDPVEPDDPDKPSKPSKPDKPKIPQTGAVLWPVFMLLAAGVLLVIAGAADLMRGRKL